LSYLKEDPGQSSPKAFLDVIERLEVIRKIKLNLNLDGIHPNRIRQLSRLGSKYEPHSFRRFEENKRYAMLALYLYDLSQSLVDFAIAFVVLLVIMLFYRVFPTWQILALPLFLMLAIVAALGLGLWLSAMNVQFRDIRYVIPFLSQFWMYATPIVWPISMFPEKWRWALGFNPMTGAVEGFRWAVLGQTDAPTLLFLVSIVVAIIMFWTGMVYFRRMERSFADII
jgi:lipopolysaccharide transport system permease protein